MFSLSFYPHLQIETGNGSALVFSKAIESENAVAWFLLQLAISIADVTLSESSSGTLEETIFFRIGGLGISIEIVFFSPDFSRLREFERDRLRVSLRGDFERERVRLFCGRLSRESDLLRRRWRRSRLPDLLRRRRRRSRLPDLLRRLLDPRRGSLVLMDPGDFLSPFANCTSINLPQTLRPSIPSCASSAS